MKKILKNNLPYICTLILLGAISGVPTAFYTLEITDPQIMEEALAQIGGVGPYVLVSLVQTISYALFCGIVGKIFSEKLGPLEELQIREKTRRHGDDIRHRHGHGYDGA